MKTSEWQPAIDRPDLARKMLGSIPDQPGVYVFRDVRGKVLYVGKGKSLRKRVMSYFNKSATGSLRTAQMVKRIRDFDFVVTTNETEALLLEANFIKHHHPPYNVMLRDDKSYPYVAITLNDEFPRVIFTRNPHHTGTAYFGPFVSAGRLRETLDLLGKIFPYRKCRGIKPGRRTGSPCLNYHIGRCLAPCAGKVDQAEYRQIILKLERLLGGRPEGLVEELRRAMKKAADAQRFEQATFIRNRLQALEHLLEKQNAMATGLDSLDVIGIHTGADGANVQVLQVRDGNLVNRRSFFLKNTADELKPDILEQFMIHYYSTAIGLPHEVVIPAGGGDIGLIQELLSEQKGARVEVKFGNRGKRRELAQMAARNARMSLEQDQLRQTQVQGRPAQALKEIQDIVQLKHLPRRIECFDISNIGGEHAVGSMAVFIEGTPETSQYRRFAIRKVPGPDDFAMMSEILSRRFASGSKDQQAPQNDASHDPSFASYPDLVLVDGGAGQVSAAMAALRIFGQGEIPVIGLAKKFEELHFPDRREPLRLPADSPALLLLTRIRDEAHRFAITYHRQKRDGSLTGSILDGIPGIGKTRKRAILAHFGSPERFLAASSDELEAVPGLPGKVARDAFAFVHKMGQG